jgi:CCR4-NOT complex subunit CAF16
MSEHQKGATAIAAQSERAAAAVPAIRVSRFSFAYGSGGVTEEPTASSVLRSVNFEIPVGARVLVVGLNGSGKSTLMRCLSGQHFHQHEQIQVLGQPAFFSSSLQREVVYLGSEWRNSALVRTDVAVERVLRGATGFTEAKLTQLTELLNIDAVSASMARLSDGQRQGVQIAAALMKEYQVLLMDETTVECDVLVRKRLLAYLKQRPGTVVYCTHVFDGMASWPSHIMHVGARGNVSIQRVDECAEYLRLKQQWDPNRDSPLSALVEQWLERDHAERLVMRKERLAVPPPSTVEEQLNASGKVGDKYYNYWG